jgi:hypothetical protein
VTGRRLVVAAAVLALAAGCAGGAEPTRGDDEETGSLADVLWIDDSLAEGDVDTCDSVAVLSDPSQDLRVAVVDEDRVFVPEVTPPAGSDVVIRRDWLTWGGCVPTAAGPVVVVEARVAYANLYDDEPKIVAGFTPDGEQLWSVELAGDLAGSYDGRGSIIFESLDDNEWLLVDARSGATVASGHGVDDAPVTSLGPTLVDDIDGGLTDLESGKDYGSVGDTTAQVDDDRILLQTVQGVRLVRLPDLKVIWKAQEDVRLTGIWTRAADLSTSTVVAFATDGRIIGLDLETGREKWSSSVERGEVNGLNTQVGSGVVVFRRNGQDPLGQVVLDSATGEELTGADGFVLADQGLLLEITSGVATQVTVDDLR